MTSAHDNEALMRVGRGTVMGDMMREYWLPACLSSELVAGEPPLRLLLLGEKLIAFRDQSGRVGIMDHRCPHRCASLFFGRPEKDGIRCVYHGWKFDVEGRCLDMPNLPPEEQFTGKVKADAYKAVEHGGMVWAYMGGRAKAPPFPQIEGLSLPDEERIVRVHQRECNWLQALEGDIDTSHFSFLHLGGLDPADVDPANMHRHALVHPAPKYHVRETDWGTMFAAYRPADAGNLYYRFSQFIFPFVTLPPDGTFTDHVQVNVWVPMDDTHTMVYAFFWTKRSDSMRTTKDGVEIPGTIGSNEYLPRTDDWYGRWRPVARRENDYLIDRDVQNGVTYSGIQGFTAQDQAVTESMESMVDRTREHLAPSDRMITATRRRLLSAANALRDHGTPPPGVELPEITRDARAGCFVVPEGKDWYQAYQEHLAETVSPLWARQAAE